jgi:hypothetical protein
VIGLDLSSMGHPFGTWHFGPGRASGFSIGSRNGEGEENGYDKTRPRGDADGFLSRILPGERAVGEIPVNILGSSLSQDV